MIRRAVADAVQHGRNMVDLQKVEKLARGERYSRTNVFFLPYTPEVVQHLLRYHWAYAESMAEIDEDIQCVFIDLQGAIARLEGDEKVAVSLLIDGWAAGKTDNDRVSKYTDIARKMSEQGRVVRPPQVKELLHAAFLRIAESLGYERRKDDTDAG